MSIIENNISIEEKIDKIFVSANKLTDLVDRYEITLKILKSDLDSTMSTKDISSIRKIIKDSINRIDKSLVKK